MARTKKSAQNQGIDEFVGAKVQAFRNERGWTLAELSDRLGVSVSHLKALETGRYSFSVSMMVTLVETLKRPIHAFVPAPSQRESLQSEWDELHGALLARDRVMLCEIGRKLVGWSDAAGSSQRHAAHAFTSKTKLLTIEGIDGVLLRDLGKALVAKLGKHASPASLVWYDFDDPLTRYLVDRVQVLTSSPEVEPELQHSHACEKTLLFACERLQRQETKIRTELSRGQTVITPFFSMAAGVYQKVDGAWDLHVVEWIESLLLKPDLVVLVDSDPQIAASRATRKRPSRGEFYSPYEKVEQFESATRLYATISQDFRNRGYRILHLDARSGASMDDLTSRILAQMQQA